MDALEVALLTQPRTINPHHHPTTSLEPQRISREKAVFPCSPQSPFPVSPRCKRTRSTRELRTFPFHRYEAHARALAAAASPFDANVFGHSFSSSPLLDVEAPGLLHHCQAHSQRAPSTQTDSATPFPVSPLLDVEAPGLLHHREAHARAHAVRADEQVVRHVPRLAFCAGGVLKRRHVAAQVGAGAARVESDLQREAACFGARYTTKLEGNLRPAGFLLGYSAQIRGTSVSTFGSLRGICFGYENDKRRRCF